MDWILTYSGIKFDLVNPTLDMVCTKDIAHALSQECRYGGHCSPFFSVAAHSLLVMMNAPHSLRLEALLHDAAEAYCKDIPRPMKQLLGPEWHNIYGGVDTIIRKKFGLPSEESPGVKVLDQRALITEMQILMPKHVDLKQLFAEVDPFDNFIFGEMLPEEASYWFNFFAHKLTTGASPNDLDEHIKQMVRENS